MTEQPLTALAGLRRRGLRSFALRMTAGMFALSLLLAGAALACEIPVYEWALMNWPPDTYELLVYNDEPLPENASQVLEALANGASSSTAPALNLRVRMIGAGDIQDDAAQIREREAPEQGPWMALRHPTMPPNFPSVWSAPISDEALRLLTDSPARRQIASALSRGVSHVWVLVESGKEEQDAQVRARLEETLTRANSEIDPASISPNAHITHEIVSVPRDDPAEAVLVQTLLRSEPDLLAYGDPMVFPVFGRGRALYALVGAGISAENVLDACRYIAGRCSCLVKDQNPGVDLLLAADWTEAAASVAAALPSGVESQAGLAESTPAPPLPQLGLGRYILAALAAALILVALLSAILLRRSFSPASTR